MPAHLLNPALAQVGEDVRERANTGWDQVEIHWRERTWDKARWQLEAVWPRGLRVRVTDGPNAGVLGTVSSNRVYASDQGAWVTLDNDRGGLIHWSHLEPVSPNA